MTTSVATPHDTTNTTTGASVYGTGTSTAAAGTTGTLTVFDTHSVVSADLTNASGGVPRTLYTEEPLGSRKIVTTDTVTPTGVLTQATLTRMAAHHH